MKRMFGRLDVWTFGLVALPLLVAGCTPQDGRGRSPSGPDPITLTAENARVVIAPDAPPTVRFAADEMTNFLAQVLGGPVPIGTEVEKRGGGGERTVNIVLGTNKWSVAAGIAPEKLPRDSFVVSTSIPQNPNTSKPDAIFIAGCDDPKWDPRKAIARGDSGEGNAPYERATLFGVYDFLERYAGCRFYFPGPLGTIVPNKASLTVPVGTAKETPAFVKRMWYEAIGAPMPGDESGIRDRRIYGTVQMLRHRRYAGCPLIHGMRHLALRERFGKTHPEYFAAVRKKDGTLIRDPYSHDCVHICWTSGVMDEIFKDFEAYAKGEKPSSRGYPAGYDRSSDPWAQNDEWPRLAFLADHVSIFPEDGFRACQCENCSKFYPNGKPEGKSYASKLVWYHTAKLAQRMKDAGLKLKLEQSAYTSYLEIPEGVDIPDNVVVGYCCNGPWDELNPKNRDQHVASVRAWCEKAGGSKVFLHNWACKYSRTNIPDLPAVSPHSCGAYYARIAPWANGVYQEAASDHYAHSYLSTYITARQTWDPAFDYEAAIQEHHELMFGPAAPEMKAFFDDCEKLWVGKIMNGRTEMNALGPVQLVPDKLEIWRTIYTEEKIAEWERLFAAAEKKVKGKGERSTKEGLNSSVNLQPSTSTCSTTSNLQPDLYARRLALIKRDVFDPVAKARKDFADWTDAAKEEARRKREGVKNLLDKEYSAEFFVPAGANGVNHEAQGKNISMVVPFKFETNTTYRLSFFIETEDIRISSNYAFNGALVGIWTEKPMRWHFSYGNRAITSGTFGRIAQTWTFKTGNVFETKGISVWLRGCTGRMKVDGMILEKVK